MSYATLIVPTPVIIVCPAQTDIKISAIADAATSSMVMSGFFAGWYA